MSGPTQTYSDYYGYIAKEQCAQRLGMHLGRRHGSREDAAGDLADALPQIDAWIFRFRV